MIINKKTKIVATLGPATNTKETLTELASSGVNVFRINFSHADYEDVKKRVKQIREINHENGYNVAVLADLQGPKLRVGVMEEGIMLKDGDEFIFTTEECVGNNEKAYMTYQNFPRDVKPGEQILVDDGKLLFEVISDAIKKSEIIFLEGYLWDEGEPKKAFDKAINIISLCLTAFKFTSFSLIFPAVPKNVHMVLSESGVTNIKQVPVGNSSFFFE